MSIFESRLKWLVATHKETMGRKNEPMPSENGDLFICYASSDTRCR